MKLSLSLLRISVALLCPVFVTSQSIAEINGNKFLSPYRNQPVSNVTGLVTAIGPSGFWMRSTTPDKDVRTSESIYVYGALPTNATVATGDIIILDGRVTEYRSSAAYLFLTEITQPSNIRTLSRAKKVEPVELGKKDTKPPTEQFSSLDGGDVFALPNNASLISVVNPVLEPGKFGLDFWESLSGELVKIKKPVAASKPNNFGDTWVTGNWKLTSENNRGGVTLTSGDGNPEAILIGSPLDGSSNPAGTKLGDKLDDIVGVVTQAFGFYRVLPLTAVVTEKSEKPALPKGVDWKSGGSCKKFTVGVYNVENLAPTSPWLPDIAGHIVKYLNSPDLLFLQEVQDSNGPTNDDVVSANVTYETLIASIVDQKGVNYNYIDIDPVDDQDGGQPGGNIRTGYLYNPAVIKLKNINPGSAIDANQVLAGPSLKFNPGRIDPANPAWQASRKPLVAQWETVKDKSTLFTVNVHFSSKGGSSSIEGDARPPVNGGVAARIAQANITASFISEILRQDAQANIIAAGDFNEFSIVRPLQNFVAVSGLKDLDEVAKIKPTERYTYLFDMNSQQLDHVYVSPRIAAAKPDYEHVHVNTWVSSADEISDHDPSVARVNIC
ncbi:hypothetical protein PV10_08859 [Exophiala mesophila]|uniref:Endonuclease/exonuclease/phosphatase domain-containing protein n=1 Tax=Exophiala mesophila TaxID=212818 RepID=A0A0D1XMA3_EXOME|nr:uncharacterized protein PV10_08859 [Exophiala mesophila]KIV89281.1 hypothetical protein PV10_08859 [Exophiala mesophila]